MDELGGRYRILSPLGAGGMGEVFLAEDSRLERRVAVKLLPESIKEDQIARERLRREALAAAALDHPFICKVHEIGDTDGRPFIVMEYVEGETLHAAVRRGPLPIREVIEIAFELAQALDTAHRRNIIHRDLKPANVMLTPQRHVKVMDFGLAKQLDASKPSSSSGNGHGSDAGTTLTDAGSRLGTPAYMSPEQILGGTLDPRSDIFSLGVILHELAAGAHPFLKDDPSETMAAILRDPPRPGPRDVETVGGLSAVINRMLSKACAGRHQTMEEVLADLGALRERAWSSSSRHAIATSPPPAERTPLVGRQAETAELEKALDRMLTGHGSLVLIGGEPGVGKTRLVRDLLAKARERGCMALTGHCYEMEGAPPFVPFVEMVEETVRLVPKAARAAMGEYAAEMSAIVPSLRRTYNDIPPLPTDVPADQQRRLIFSAVLQYVQRGAQKSPGVLLFDDLHWGDEPTLQLLAHFAPHLASLRTLIIGTYRDVELDVNRPFAKTLESLLRQRLATRITLRRLNESGVQQMLSAMGGSAAPSGLAKAVFKETEGNPFFVEEVYQHLAEEGKLFDASGAWKPDLRVDTIEVPEGVRLVIGRRLDRLGEKARKVLTAAAVIGRTFPLDLLEAVVDVSQDDVLDAVEEAERAQLLSADNSKRTPRYGFVHELIRTTLAAGLSMPRRQRLHLRIADAIEKLRASSLESQASVLAHHLYQAGAAADAQRTAKALALASARAIAAGAFEEAIEGADNLLGLELADDDPFVSEALERKGYALSALKRYDDSAAVYMMALDRYATRRDDGGIERAAAGAASNYFWRGLTSGLDIVLRAVDLLSEDARRERATLLSLAAAARSSRGHLDEAGRLMAEALTIAEGCGDAVTLSRVLYYQAIWHRTCCEYAEAIVAGTRALEMLPAHLSYDHSNGLISLASVDYYVGELSRCEQRLTLVEQTAPGAGNSPAVFLAEQIRCVIAWLRSGDSHAALAAFTELVKVPIFRFLNRTGVGLCQLYLGDLAGAMDSLETASKETPEYHFLKGIAEGSLVAAAALAGDGERARALMSDVEPWLPMPGQRNVQGAFYAADALVNGLAFLGEKERRASLYPVCLEHIKTGTVVASLMAGPSNPQLAAALAADAAGLTERAREHFEAALRQAREVPMRMLEPSVLYWYGRMLTGGGDAIDHSRGRAMIEEARNGFRSFGMALHERLCSANL